MILSSGADNMEVMYLAQIVVKNDSYNNNSKNEWMVPEIIHNGQKHICSPLKSLFYTLVFKLACSIHVKEINKTW